MQNRILRTPESCFSGLPGFTFAPHYLTLVGAAGDAPRMHYLDENAGRPLTALLLHGEPTWSCLNRHKNTPVVAAGFRAGAPDWIGCASRPSTRPSTKVLACSSKSGLRFGGGIFSPKTRS